MSEFELINRFFRSASRARQDVITGIGDDCAVLKVPSNKLLAVSTDTLIAGTHFPVETSARDIGFKSLAVNLSDLAAMGADPAWVSLALSLPEANDEWLGEFVAGMCELTDKYHVQLIGGDTTRGALSITIQVFGFLEPEKVLQRNQARAGDLIYVSGTIGDAGLGLKYILNKDANAEPYFVERLNRPTPRLALSEKIRSISRCAIDISDGLLADLGHICEQSECGAVLDLEHVPVSDELKKHYANNINWQQVLGSGDDYELCFTISPDYQNRLVQIASELDLRLTKIGKITADKKISCLLENGNQVELASAGYDHF